MKPDSQDNIPLIEVVVNVSEGKDQAILNELKDVLLKYTPLLLHLDQGYGANRTVFTVVFEADSVIRSLLNFYRVAIQRINLQNHKGAHPRIGAVDVCPLIALNPKDTTLAIDLSLDLAKSVAKEFDIPVYLYEHSCKLGGHRKSLAEIRKGGLESLSERIKTTSWRPDFGPTRLHDTAGATVIGVREFLVAYNLTLNTLDLNVAKDIAKQIRNPNSTRAIGWFIDEYNLTQVSCNIINTDKVNLAKLYNNVQKIAHSLGCKVIGSEIIGLIPIKCFEKVIAESGQDYQKLVNHNQVHDLLNLSFHKPFILNERIIECALMLSNK